MSYRTRKKKVPFAGMKHQIRARASDNLVARTVRLALVKHGDVRAVPTIAREALKALADRDEPRLKLPPLTKREEKKLLEAA